MESLSVLTNLAAGAQHLVKNIIVALIIYIVGKKLIDLAVKGLEKITAKAGTDATLTRFLVSAAKILLYVVMIFMIVAQLGFNTASLLTVLGSAAVAVGLALQGSLANVAGGVLILFTRPFKVGDYVITGSGEGTVEEIGLIYTKLITLDKKVITVPNGSLTNAPITNCSTSPLRRVDISISVGHNADIRKAMEVIESVYRANPDILQDQPVSTFISDVADTVVIGACGFTEGGKYWPVRWKLLEDIKLALTEANIALPHGQLDIHMKND